MSTTAKHALSSASRQTHAAAVAVVEAAKRMGWDWLYRLPPELREALVSLSAALIRESRATLDLEAAQRAGGEKYEACEPKEESQ